jgi:flagellar motor switch protein FliN
MSDEQLNSTLQPASETRGSGSRIVDPERVLQNAEEALASVEASMRGPVAEPYCFQGFSSEHGPSEACSIDVLGDVPLDLRIELGRATMQIDEILKLRSGAVVSLDRATDDLVDVYANGRMIARGEMVVLNGSYGIRITELIGSP